jgi:RNA polymerase sigma-B factor
MGVTDIGPPRPSRRPNEIDAVMRHFARTHSPDAREQVFIHFLPLARNVARRYHSVHESNEELVQVACIGLLGAIDRFDPDRGVRFSSFAIPTIVGELKRHFRNTGWTAHVPRGAQELALRVDRAATEINQESGRAPTPMEIAGYLELELDDVLIGLDAQGAHFARSLDAPSSADERDEAPSLHDVLGGDDDGYALIDAKLSVAAILPRLPWLERTALRLRVEEDLKQEEIAERMNCSQMQVSRLLRSAARRVRLGFDPELEAA